MLNLFEPESIAIIGASNDLKKWGGNILYNLIQCGYNGEIYPVNPKEKYIQGHLCFKSIIDVPYKVDVAVIVVPAISFIPVLIECGKKGVGGIVAITAGFKEIGNTELETEVVTILNQYNMRLLGPNCLGYINTAKNINVSVIQQTPTKGGISFIAQSGTMGIAMVENAVRNGIGLNKIISTGNKADINDVDLLKYLDKDKSTKVIVIYAESIECGKEFIEVARKITKPIIILKSGISQKGAKAAFSHTGSMAGTDEIYSVAFRQAGVIRVEQMEEIFDAAIVFSQNSPRGNKVGIISNGGGAGILATDLCEKYNIEVPDINYNLKLEEFSTVNNPIDTAADNRYETYYNCVDMMINDSNIDAIIIIYVHTQLADSVPPAKAIVDVIAANSEIRKPVITCFFGGPGYENGEKILEEKGIPNYITPERAVRALDYLLQYKFFQIYFSRGIK